MSGALATGAGRKEVRYAFRRMGVFVRAVVTGFGFSLGSALFKRVSGKLGLSDPEPDSPDPGTADGDDDGDDGGDG